MKFNELYLDFLRYSISTDKEPPREIEKINWKRYLDFCGQPIEIDNSPF